MRRILAAVKDTGGKNAVLPVVKALSAAGHHVDLVASGVSVKALRDEGETFVEVKDSQEVPAKFDMPDVVITSMCSNGGPGRDLVPLVRGKAIVVALQDQWGSRLLDSWADTAYRPDYIVVNDEVGNGIVRRAWPEYQPYRIHNLGYAALDALHGFDVAATRRKVRTTLDFDDAEGLVYFSGQLKGTTDALEELLKALADIGYDGNVMAGRHPRLSQAEYATEDRRWDALIGRFGQTIPICTTEETRQFGEIERIAAADLTVSMYSTALMHAAALRKPAISILYASSPMSRAYREETGGLMREYPLATLQCVGAPVTSAKLTEDVLGACEGSLEPRLRPFQEEHIIVDGRNAERIARFVSGLKT